MFNFSDPTVLLTWLLSAIIFLPAVGALILCLAPRESDASTKRFSLFITLAVFALTVWLAIPGGRVGNFNFSQPGMQSIVNHTWIPAFGINYMLGIDGISLPLVLLTSFLSVLAMWASWPITKSVRAYCALFLLLETGMLGVFLALDFFLFYVFWEVMLLPMYFLIGIWGGPRREYAAIKFFLFTLVGSVLLLVAMLMLYFASDVSKLSQAQQVASNLIGHGTKHTFNLLALMQLGQMPDSPFHQTLLWGQSLSWWAFVLLLIGFIIKLPSVPVHTWLPDAHVEAPTPISMILAGVLLKMGGYGVLRVCYPVCPDAGYHLAWLVSGLGTVSMVYGALAAMAQKDFKRLVAYSSVSHMGYVLLGIGAWSATAGTSYDPNYWNMAMNGAMFQMIAHGISSAGMFFLVGVVYERVHHRDLDKFGGLFARMPVYAGISMVIFFAALGLPGLCGFIGEFFVVVGTWAYCKWLAVVAASVVVLTAGYILWTIQRVYLGPEYKGPHADALTPMTRREIAIAAPLVAFALLLGVYPQALFKYTEPTIGKTVVQKLTDWAQASPKATGHDVTEGRSQ
ncbi:MAG: NADH-quinone oxidoreductase subunit M [Planctomycetaceae bacterium]|nr:NADH-quinone oxidoreductase subunit M [Planctomycetaceae bacterium]